MKPEDRDRRHEPVRVVVDGIHGRLVLSFLNAASTRLGWPAVEKGRVGDTEYLQAGGKLPDGREVSILALATPTHRALAELALSKASGVVYLFDVHDELLASGRAGLSMLAENCSRAGLRLDERPFVLHYCSTSAQPAFDADRMDAWLGVSPDSVARVATPNAEPTSLDLLFGRLGADGHGA